ncbi:MAG: DUF4830 domain-containing protein [Clostridia bacterium]|nr:DUF4830 domain-containing protein [Clostridia bacterium]
MKLYFAFNKVYAVIMLSFLLFALAVCSTALGVKNEVYLKNEGQRAAYLKQYGYSVFVPETVKEIVIPFSFKGDYLTEALQLSGFNIKAFRGKSLWEYTYAYNGNLIRIITDGDKLVGAFFLDCINGRAYPLAGENVGTNKTG